MERCLVTGGAGFIGSHLVENLLKQGHSVRVLDNFETGSRSNLGELQKEIEIVAGSVEDVDTVNKVVRGIDWIFHEAARVSVPQSLEDPVKRHLLPRIYWRSFEFRPTMLLRLNTLILVDGNVVRVLPLVLAI